MAEAESNSELRPLFASHSRNWRQNLYVYPVISRRSEGLSVGVNLNPDKACNFDCVYCQVDRREEPSLATSASGLRRTSAHRTQKDAAASCRNHEKGGQDARPPKSKQNVPRSVRKVDPEVLRDELDHMVGMAVSGELFKDVQFGHVPEQYRRFNDIAFSGDGEPTTSPQFGAAVHIAAEVRRKYALDGVKLTVITDSAYLTRPKVVEALAELDANNGEIWAKLDAGTEEYYRLINRPNVPLATILENITQTARVRPVVIQSLWMYVRDAAPADAEVDAFAGRLREILQAGGRLKMVQMHTIARQTAEPWVAPLEAATLERLAERVRAVVGVPVKTYAG